MLNLIERYFKLIISEDKMYAYLKVEKKPPKHTLKSLTLDTFRQYLGYKGIEINLYSNNLMAWIFNDFSPEELNIAHANTQLFNRAVLNTLIPSKKQLKKNDKVMRDINEGETFLEIVPKQHPVVGEDIFGKRVKFKEFRINDFVGENIEHFEQDGKYYLKSKKTGLVKIMESKVSVFPNLVIEEGINYSTGNIYSPGNVIINGDVLTGFEIHAGGNVRLNGVLEGSKIFAEGSIETDYPVIGFKKARLLARKSIKLSSARDATLMCTGNISVDKNLTNVDCVAFGKLTTSAQGRIIGGKIVALKGVEAGTIGSKDKVPTSVITGIDPFLIDEYENCMLETKKIDLQLKTIIKNLKFLVGHLKIDFPPELDSFLKKCCYIHNYIEFESQGENNDNYLKVTDLLFKMELFEKMEESIAVRLEQIRKTILTNSNVLIIIKNSVHPGTTLNIKNKVAQIKDKRNRLVYYLKDNELSYKEIQGG